MMNNKSVERVSHFFYLATINNEHWDHSKEIRTRVEKARTTFNETLKLFKNHSIHIDLRVYYCATFS